MAKYKSIFKSNLFDGDVILITGGGSGIGRCIAHELASLGAMAIVAGRRIEQLRRVTNEIRQYGGQADFVQMNIRNEESIKQAVTTILEKHHKITGTMQEVSFHHLRRQLQPTDGRLSLTST
jgi:citronellol/citronellal dehydrogenase